MMANSHRSRAIGYVTSPAEVRRIAHPKHVLELLNTIELLLGSSSVRSATSIGLGYFLFDGVKLSVSLISPQEHDDFSSDDRRSAPDVASNEQHRLVEPPAHHEGDNGNRETDHQQDLALLASVHKPMVTNLTGPIPPDDCQRVAQPLMTGIGCANLLGLSDGTHHVSSDLIKANDTNKKQRGSQTSELDRPERTRGQKCQDNGHAEDLDSLACASWEDGAPTSNPFIQDMQVLLDKMYPGSYEQNRCCQRCIRCVIDCTLHRRQFEQSQVFLGHDDCGDCPHRRIPPANQFSNGFTWGFTGQMKIVVIVRVVPHRASPQTVKGRSLASKAMCSIRCVRRVFKPRWFYWANLFDGEGSGHGD